MTKKTTDRTSQEMNDLRALIIEIQTALATTIQTSMQNSIQQLGESLATRLDTMTTTLITQLEPRNQQAVNVQQLIPPHTINYLYNNFHKIYHLNANTIKGINVKT